jgi:hypothetical protein
MGKEVINGKVKFVINNRNDCLMYLGHLLEYAVKKKLVYWDLIEESILYYAHELDRSIIKLSGDISMDKILMIEDKRIEVTNISFSKHKLFTSALALVENEIINLIGDFSKDKQAISYNNYLSIIKNNTIEKVEFQQNNKRDKIIKKYNENRNYNAHFTSDKLCEWIEFRINQTEVYENATFEFGDDFNIYVSSEIPLSYLRKDLIRHMKLYFEYETIINYIKSDFEIINGGTININVNEEQFDHTIKPISLNGRTSHCKSSKRESK